MRQTNSVMPNTHRRHGRDSTVELSRVEQYVVELRRQIYLDSLRQSPTSWCEFNTNCPTLQLIDS